MMLRGEGSRSAFNGSSDRTLGGEPGDGLQPQQVSSQNDLAVIRQLISAVLSREVSKSTHLLRPWILVPLKGLQGSPGVELEVEAAGEGHPDEVAGEQDAQHMLRP